MDSKFSAVERTPAHLEVQLVFSGRPVQIYQRQLAEHRSMLTRDRPEQLLGKQPRQEGEAPSRLLRFRRAMGLASPPRWFASA